MSLARLLLAGVAVSSLVGNALAVEGSSTAGPIGGTDMRSAQLPPPGLYMAGVYAHAVARRFFDGSGNAVPALDALDLARDRGGVILLWVPQTQVLGGSLGFLGVVSGGMECGRLFSATPRRCIQGAGDPYVEIDWSRHFGTVRQSQYPGAFPIAEGLTVQLGLGAVIPTGRFDAVDATRQGLVIGNNVWDVAPIAAVTYVTRPIIADGTELSAKAYWNNYWPNSDTRYSTGSLINIDFALTEKIGPLQLGLAGFHAFQVDDDKQAGFRIPPDGRRATITQLGGVVAYDMPEHGASLNVKAMKSVVVENAVESWGISVALVKKLH